jgi:DNA repair exonuclease SbcCD ATPase subunit
MSIIQDQIPQLRFLNETNMKENFFSTIVEQEGKQYDNETKTKFTKYYHHFFLENLNGKINNKPVNTPEGLKELQNLLKEFQKLRDPEFYVEEKEEEYKEKEILEKIDMTYEPNLNLMRDFVKGNMKTKFEAYVEPNIKIKEGVVELKTERVIELIKEVSDKLEEQKDNIIEDTEKINEQLVEIKKLQEIIENQKEIIENQKEDYSIQKENYNKQKEEDKDKYSKLKDAHKKEMDDELEKGSKEFQKKIEEIIQNHEGDKSEINSKLNEYLNNLETKKKELKEKEKENKILLENNEKQEQGINKFKNDIDVLNNKNKELDENSKRIETDMNDKITKLTEENIGLKNTIEMATEENESLKKENDTKLAAIAKELEEEKDKSAVSLDEAVAKMTSNLLESENMNEELRKQLIDDLVKLKAESSSLRNEKKNISKKMEEYEKELKEYKKRIDNEFQKISVQNNQLQSDLEKDKQEIERLNSNNKNLQNQNKELSAKEGELEKQINTKTEEKENLKTQLTSTQEELETYKRKNTELQQQIDILKKQQEDLEKQQTELQNQYKEQSNMLNEDLKGKDITIDELRKQLEAKIKEIADNKAQIEAKSQEIAAKEAQIKDDMRTITNLQKIVSPLQEHITELENSIAKLTSEKDQVDKKLDAIRAKEEEAERKRLAEEDKKRQVEEENEKQNKEKYKTIANKEIDKSLLFVNNLNILIGKLNRTEKHLNITVRIQNTLGKSLNTILVFLNYYKKYIANTDVKLSNIELFPTYNKDYVYALSDNFKFENMKVNDLIKSFFEALYACNTEECNEIKIYIKPTYANESIDDFLKIDNNFVKQIENTKNAILNYLKSCLHYEYYQNIDKDNNIYDKEIYEHYYKTIKKFKEYTEYKEIEVRKLPNEEMEDEKNKTVKEIKYLRVNNIDKLFEESTNGVSILIQAYKYITDFANKYCKLNETIPVSIDTKKYYKQFEKTEKHSVTHFKINLTEDYITNIKKLDSNRKQRNKKDEDTKYKNSNCETHIKEILDAFNNAFVKQDNSVLQTPSQSSKNKSDATTEERNFVPPSSSQGNKTKDNNNYVKGNPSDISATPTRLNFNSPQQKGGKKKTRRKGRTKKKTKTRKK